MHPDQVKTLIETGLNTAKVFVEGDGAHFQAIVIYQGFTGKSRIQKQQLVYDTVRAQLLDGSLHALSTQCFTPEEWETIPTTDTLSDKSGDQ